VRHFGTELGTPKPVVFALSAATSVRSRAPFDSMIRSLFMIDFDPLGERDCQLRAGGKSPRALSPYFAA
jgi:hypothetical protein